MMNLVFVFIVSMMSGTQLEHVSRCKDQRPAVPTAPYPKVGQLLSLRAVLHPFVPRHLPIMICIQQLHHFTSDGLSLFRTHVLHTLVIKSVESEDLVAGPCTRRVKVMEREESPGIKVANVMLLLRWISGGRKD